MNTKARILSFNRDDFLNFAVQHEVVARIEARYVMLRGQKENVEIVLKHIETLTSNEITIELKSKSIVGVVIGKKGSTILEMERKYGVVCNVTDNTIAQLDIKGPKDKIEACAKEFRELIRENTYTEERFDVEMSSFLAQDIRSSNMFRNVARKNKCYFTLKYVVFEREARVFPLFHFFMFQLRDSNQKNITHIAHEYHHSKIKTLRMKTRL